MLTADSRALVGLSIVKRVPPSADNSTHQVLQQARRELDQYFAGTRKHFDVPVELMGTAFQRSIWNLLTKIPFGDTVSYGELAEKVGKPHAARAIGGAVGANPVPIIVPCHRVMGVSGLITGYSAGDGISTKKVLLDLEGIAYRF